ncbi:MAG: hypothetical protein II724_04915, partial [Clostridia bacterium]|nr:hypothetical protein [Clostridia bacterium]
AAGCRPYDRSGDMRVSIQATGRQVAAPTTGRATCGFRIILEKGYDHLHGEEDDHDLGPEYRYPGE